MKQISINKLWIDESGDCGFKFDKGSSRFLVIAAVYCIGNDGVEKSMDELKLRMRLIKNYEFKFSRCKDDLKKEFFTVLNNLPIQYKVIIADKKKLGAPALKFQPQQLYCELVRRLFYDNDPPLERATLFIDEAAAKIHHREFNTVLKKYLSKNIVSKIRQKRSQNETMIQVADMIAGSIFRKYEKREDKYYQQARNKEKILIEF